MNNKTLITVGLTLLVAYTLAKTQLGNQVLSVRPRYFD